MYCSGKTLQIKKSDFLIVSGGYVHPFQTPYCEAEEMRRYLVDSLSVPADRIIMEPHARHTTTNIRNANRIIYDNSMPANMPVLGVSVSNHIAYISGKEFRQVCLRDLKYVPFTNLKKLSDQTVSYYPVKLSMQINETDPLEP